MTDRGTAGGLDLVALREGRLRPRDEASHRAGGRSPARTAWRSAWLASMRTAPAF
jgi:hypothetical protein